MRIAIITFHNTLNYGATLQCTALFRYLSQLGHDVYVINYLPRYVLDKKSITKELKNITSSGNKGRALLKGLLYLAFAGKIKSKDDRYELFLKKNIRLTRIYSSYEDLTADPPKAELYICGSDQIWNPYLTGNAFDKAFFLKFTDGIKASYGASVGELDIESNKDELRELTRGFWGISMRERTSAKQLVAALERDVFTVLDCTLLLNREDYFHLEVDYTIHDKYLLLYNVKNSSVAVSIARKIAKEKKLEIVDISPNPFVNLKGTKKIIDIGPGEFLNLFHNAEFVITNSFHGTAFSIIYKKQFVVIPHSTRSSRITDLLEALGLSDRIAIESGYVYNSPIDYSTVYKRLAKLRTDSRSFLAFITASSDARHDGKFHLQDNDSTSSQMNKTGIERGSTVPVLVGQRVCCCGCSACFNVCPQSAIKMKRDSEGFLYPHIDITKCIKCCRCLEVCQFKRDIIS